MTSYVYGLIDNSRHVIAYVGATDGPVARRVGAAWSHRYSQSGPLELWLRSLDDPPVWIVLEETTPEELELREAFWIATLRLVNPSALLNTALYGRGRRGYRVSDALRDEHRRLATERHQREREEEQQDPAERTCSCGRISPTRRGLGIHKAKTSHA